MRPFFFGPPSRRLFGAFHEASPGRSQSLAVLLCNPFGQEAIRTQRLFRVLAGRLSQAGIHVLRFDYFGSGDSAGDDDAGELDGWAGDVVSAHEELLALSRAGRVTWMGARLGATAAIHAARWRLSTPVQRLVVWDPVVEGAAYAESLRARHVEALEASYSVPDPAWRRMLRDEPASFRDQAIGIALAPVLREQLSRLDAGRLELPGTLRTLVLADEADHAVRMWVEAQRARGATIEALPLKQALEWTSDDSLNAALVPAEAVQRLLLAIDR